RRVADRVRHRPSRSRSPVFALLRQAAGPGVASADALRGRTGTDCRLVSPERLVVGADSLRGLPRVLRAPLRASAQSLMNAGVPAARGRHAPPREVRVPLQRERLLRAAAEEFAKRGYAGASSESISRRAGMSKATFYEHFANKEDCMVALFDVASETLLRSMAEAAELAGLDPDARIQASTHAYLTTVA